MADKPSPRHIAHKIAIYDLLKAQYIIGDEQSSNYLLCNEERISRVNIIAVIVARETQGTITTFYFDDGTEKIAVRFFEEHKNITQLQIGDVVLVIGKVRLYNEERYLSPEISKKIDPLWLKVRSLERPVQNTNQKLNNIKEEIIYENLSKNLPLEKLTKLIQELDQGDGVLIEEVITKSFLKDAEVWIEKMLQDGEIFQNQPGRVKVL